MPRPSVSLAVALVLAASVSPASAVETPRSYKPIPAETGARITPAPDLNITNYSIGTDGRSGDFIPGPTPITTGASSLAVPRFFFAKMASTNPHG